MKHSDTSTPPSSMPLCVEHGHPCLPGHFPGHPLVPGVMLLEHVATVVRARYGLRVTRIVEAKFLAPLHPAREARVEVSGEPQRLRFEVRAGTELLARGRVEAGA